jgi:anti-sigma-K factor RskA
MTTNSTAHDEQRELAALYALGALTASDCRAFEAHMDGCPACAADVRSLSGVAGALAQSVPQQEPPPELRSRVLARVGHPDPSEQRSRSARRTLSPASRAWLATAALLALSVGLGAYAATLRGRIDALEARLREAILRADASDSQIAELRRVSIQTGSQMAVLASPDLQRIDLSGQAAAPQASGRAFWSRSRGLVFTASALPPLPAGRTYQLWILTPAPAPVSAGVFKPDPGGSVAAVFGPAVDLARPSAIAVTIEPEGGVPAPTGDRYLVGT